MKIIVDNYTRIMLTVIAVLLLIVGAGLWCDHPAELTRKAIAAGIPDTGKQLNEVLLRLDILNAELDQIQKNQLSGQMKVQIVEARDADKAKKGNAAPAVKKAK